MVGFYDSYGRRIRYIRLSVTDRCNFRCRYCMPMNGIKWIPHESIMRYEELIRMIRICASRGVDKVRVTGGEPLVRKDIVKFLENLNTVDGINDVSLTTNGFFLEHMASEIKGAGISRINISLDTLDKDKFAYITGVDGFERVVKGITSALEQGFDPVKINVVAMRGFNDDEFIDFAGLTIHLGIQVRFIELMPIGPGFDIGKKDVITKDEIKSLIEEAYGNLEPLPSGIGPASVFKIEGARGSLGFISPLSDKTFCSRCNRVRITADGHMKPCLFADKMVDLLTPMREGISDNELESLIEEGIRKKPGSFMTLSDAKPEDLVMSSIGG